jgi:hypothetical protein
MERLSRRPPPWVRRRWPIEGFGTKVVAQSELLPQRSWY